MNALASLRFALRSLGRDAAAGELRVLGLALVVAVASVTAVGFFTDRVGRAVERQAADVLAADLVANSGLELPAALEEEARARGLETARHTRFPSVVINAADESQLVAVKAVTDGYPLRGAVRLAPLDAPEEDTSELSGTAPAPGTVWIDPQLLSALALEPGDALTLGAMDFAVERLIAYEPDRSENAFEFAPRVMMNESDLEAAELLGPASRARFSLLMAGEPGALEGIRDWIGENMPGEARLAGVRDGSPQMTRALDRARRFLGLASVVTVLLAGAAVALAVRHFAQRQADASAVMRTLGASRREVIVWLLLRLAFIAAVASLVGIAIGWFAQLVLANLLGEWFGLTLPAPGLAAPLVGTLTAFVALAGFGLLPVLRAGRVNVMRVLQRDFGSIDGSAALAVALGLLATYAVVLLLSRDWLLSGIVVLGVVVMLSVFGLFGRLMIAGVRRLAGPRNRLSVAGLERRAASSIVQLAAFAMGIMALLLIAIVRVDLLAAWERDLPPDAPNVFVVNIQGDQVEPFAERLESQGIDSVIYPMVRARLVAHNGEPVLEDPEDEQQQRRARREYNLSYSDTLAPGQRDRRRRVVGDGRQRAAAALHRGRVGVRARLRDRRHADLPLGRHRDHGDDRQPPRRRLGVVRGELLHRREPGHAGGSAGHLGHELLHRAGLLERDERLGARVPGDRHARHRRDRDAGEGVDGARLARGRVRLPVHPARRSLRAARRRAEQPGRAHPRVGPACARSVLRTRRCAAR